MSKLLLLIIVIVEICEVFAEEDRSVSRKYPFKHGFWHHHRGIIFYSAFLAIKAKIIFLIATFISFWVFAGKAFAFLYYVSRKDKCRCPDYHGKFIFGDEPEPEFDHKLLHLGHPPNFIQQKLFQSRPAPLPQKYSTIKDPNRSNYGQSSSYQKYARSIENTFFGNMDTFKSIINKVDLTETAFDAMNVKDTACKRRFVCETDKASKDNSLLAFSMYIFSDVGLMKYRSNSTIEDCSSLGPHCSGT